MTRAAAIIGLGLATPPLASTRAHSAHFAVHTPGLTGDAARLAETINARSGIDRRGSVLLSAAPHHPHAVDQSFYPPAANPDDRGPGTAARQAAFATHAPALAAAATRRALDDARAQLASFDPAAITHLIVVSCTGFLAPGLDVLLAGELGLSSSVQRLSIGFMGCHGALVGLRTARDLALAAPLHAPAHVLLVCVELCSLHFQYSTRPDHIVANALFADGAAAAVISAAPLDFAPSSHARSHAPRTLRATATTIIPDTLDIMSWTIGDHGFAMNLGESLPQHIRTHLGPWVRAFLTDSGVTYHALADDLRWAIHPGGPRVLSAVGEALDLSTAALAPSRATLRDFGNMSSPTVLFTLAELWNTAPTDPRPIIALAFGPGLTAEATLLTPS